MNKLVTLYHLIGMNRKLPDVDVRLMYLKDIWGMEQSAIGSCEGKSQTWVSIALQEARRKMSHQTFQKTIENMWTEDEIKNIQFLPREIIGDVEVLVFIRDLLGVHVVHPFYQYHTLNITFCTLALSRLGVQNKRIQEIYDKKQSTVSMLIKRGADINLDKYDKVGRYDMTAKFMITDKPSVVQKFTMAGGSFIW